jgi:hypothetical protein
MAEMMYWDDTVQSGRWGINVSNEHNASILRVVEHGNFRSVNRIFAQYQGPLNV